MREGVGEEEEREEGQWPERLRLAPLGSPSEETRSIPTSPRSSCGFEVSLVKPF